MASKVLLFIVFTIWAIVIAFGLSDACRAEDLMSVGFGVFHSAENSPTETKIIRIARREEFDRVSFYQLEGGFWVDGAGGGRLSSAFAAGSLGIKVDLSPVFVTNALGLAVITTPDSYLGGTFPQFTEELGVGIRGTNSTSLALSYKHFSSAGILMPNMGRDFVLLTIGIGI